MKKVLLTFAACAAAVAIAATSLSATTNETEVNSLLISQVEALTGWEDIGNWWDSKEYDCTSSDCSINVGVGPFVVTYYGKYENCQSGDSYAHCWECADCDAGPF